MGSHPKHPSWGSVTEETGFYRSSSWLTDHMLLSRLPGNGRGVLGAQAAAGLCGSVSLSETHHPARQCELQGRAPCSARCLPTHTLSLSLLAARPTPTPTKGISCCCQFPPLSQPEPPTSSPQVCGPVLFSVLFSPFIPGSHLQMFPCARLSGMPLCGARISLLNYIFLTC